MKIGKIGICVAALQVFSTQVFGKGFEKCNLPDKWILPVVKATGGSTIEAARIPKKILTDLDQDCVDDISNAIFDEKMDYEHVADAIRKVQRAPSPKKN